METPNEDQAVAEILGRLADRFPEVPRIALEELVDQEHHVYDGRPIRDFVPVLVEREAKQKLRHHSFPSAA